MIRADLLARLQEELTRPAFNRWLAAVALNVDAQEQTVEVVLPCRPEFSYRLEKMMVHGGILAALADMTLHACVAVFHGAPTPTIALQIDYLAPAMGETVVARGILRKLGRSISRADVELRSDQKLVAIGRGSFSTQEKTS